MSKEKKYYVGVTEDQFHALTRVVHYCLADSEFEALQEAIKEHVDHTAFGLDPDKQWDNLEDIPKEVLDEVNSYFDCIYTDADKASEVTGELNQRIKGFFAQTMEDIRTIDCRCGNVESFPADMARSAAQSFAWAQNLHDDKHNNEALYKCRGCGELVVSECVIEPKEGE